MDSRMSFNETGYTDTFLLGWIFLVLECVPKGRFDTHA